MKEDLISIIVPVFNVEKYLDKCISSIVNQTYKNIEIILVDDGSPDTCPQLCDRWAEKDNRIVVIHKENGGLSSARNAGVRVSAGKYIGFVDSDDYIAADMYEKLYTALVEHDADMAICNYVFWDEYGNRVKGSVESPIKNEVLDRQQAFQKLDMRKPNYWYYVTAWNKLYKREIFEKVIFKEGKIHEDEFSVHYFFNLCSTIVTINDVLYYYIQHEGSIMTSAFSLKSFDSIEALWERYVFFKNNEFKSLANGTLIAAYGILLYFLSRTESINYKNEIDIWVKRILFKLISKKNFRAFKLWVIYFTYLLKAQWNSKILKAKIKHII